MAISNMQQSRQLRAGGGIMDLEPRQGYFLGKIVKKAKRGLGKVFKSPLGRAALLATAGSYAGGLGPFAKDSTMFGGKLKNLAGAGFMRGGKDNFVRNMFLKKDEDPGGKLSYGKLGLGALGLAAVTAPYLQGDEEEEIVSDPFSVTPGSIADIRSMARMRDPSLAFMPNRQYTQKNYYAANGGIARLANGGGAGQKQMMQALQAEYMKYKQQGGTMPFEQFAKLVMQQQQGQQPQMAADGGRMGYNIGGPIQEEEVVNEDTQEIVSNPDPMAELNALSLEIFGKPLDQLNEREQEALQNFISQNPEEEIIDTDQTMVE